MADLILGPAAAEVTLPKPSGTGGYPTLPVNYEKQIEEKRMSDGTKRWGLYQTKRRWSIFWGFMTWANVETIRTLYNHNHELRFKNEFEENAWYNVIFSRFSYKVLQIYEWDKYIVEIELIEA